MIARVTGGGDVLLADFRKAREAVMADPVAAKVAPECVRVCRTPDSVWSYIKAQNPELPSYASRRVFLGEAFEPLLGALERFESAPLDDLVGSGVEVLDSDSVGTAWERALDRRRTDPEGAITAARTLLESVCKTILDDLGISYSGRDDLPKIYRKVAEALTLAPNDYTDEQIKRILGGATNVVEGIGALRNSDGDAHGTGRGRYRLSERHAGLAVNFAGTMALFLMQTFEERQH